MLISLKPYSDSNHTNTSAVPAVDRVSSVWSELAERLVHRPCGPVCNGVHYLSGCTLQLNPCVFFDECYSTFGQDINANYIFSGVSEGFKIMDDSFDGKYFCSNYSSILCPHSRIQMDETVARELSLDKVSIVDHQPVCVHALGAVRKSDASMRPITDYYTLTRTCLYLQHCSPR